MAQLERNLPAKAVRSKMLLVAGLLWIDAPLCKALFGEQASRIMAFIAENDKLFYRRGDRFCAADRFREQLRKAATQMGHIGVGAILRKATDLWTRRRDELEARSAALEAKLEQLQQAATAATRKQTENAAQIRTLERSKPGAAAYSDSVAQAARQPSKSPLLIILVAGSIVSFAVAAGAPSPYKVAAIVAAIASLGASLAILPGWLAHRKALAIAGQAELRNSPEFLRKASLETAQEIRSVEDQIDQLKLDIEEQKRLLGLPYVPAEADPESEQG